MESGSTETAAFVPRHRIGRYEIVGELGRGAMGVVYKGFDPNIGRTVAIKTVLTSATNEDLLKRFRREAQAAGVLSHPNIVTIYDAGEDQGVFYIAMEYVEGQTLEKLISGGPMALEMVTTIIEDVGSALDHAHAREIIHRDIKPANIMITRGRAKVMDFGVAKLISSTATATGMVIGTPSYMSPEGVKGMPVDGRADIFSLGVVLYEMITAKRPFAGDSIPSVIYKIIGEQPSPPTTINPALHNGLDIVLAKALAKEPADRYANCAELVKDLKNFRLLKAPTAATTAAANAPRPSTPQVARTLAPPMVSGTVALPPNTVVASPPTVAMPQPAPAPPQRGPSNEPRKSWLAPLLIVGLLAAAAIGGAVWWQRQRAAQRAQQEQEEAVRATAAAKAQVVSDAAKPSPNGAAAVARDPFAPGTLAVLVKSSVPGAAISLDGKTDPSWITPYQIRVPYGTHKIEVNKPGYRSSNTEKEFTTDGPADLMFKLFPADGAPPPEKAEKPKEKAAPPTAAVAEGRLRVLTFPPNAEVVVDGKDTIYRTPVNFLLPEGRHKITLRHKRTSDYSRDMVVVGNEIVELTVNMFNPDKPIPPQQQKRFP
jgi:serine/threonine protein kinase/type II secretory pathway pseudopilin PulG